MFKDWFFLSRIRNSFGEIGLIPKGYDSLAVCNPLPLLQKRHTVPRKVRLTAG
jgi:hypothetical protein